MSAAAVSILLWGFVAVQVCHCFQGPTRILPTSYSSTTLPSSEQESATAATAEEEIVDVVVIGSGIGGLSCAGLCAKYGHETVCVEAHDTCGGVAHSFDRYHPSAPFRFDSGPSLLSGMSSPTSTNPLRQVLDAIGTADRIEWNTYDGWLVHDYNATTAAAASQSFKLTTGNSTAWADTIAAKAGPDAAREFVRFRDALLADGGLSESSTFVPPLALRDGNGVRGALDSGRTVLPYLSKLLRIGGANGALLTGPFSSVLEKYNVRHPFLRKWFDYIAFALSGLDASHTQAAAIAYMMIDLHKSSTAVLDYPMGGMGSLVDALVAGVERNGGAVRTNSRVTKLLFDDNDTGKAKCVGVQLSNGHVIKARNGVVCNAPLWNMAKLLEDSIVASSAATKDTATATSPAPVIDAVAKIRQRADDMCMTGSFMHLHLGIRKDGLPLDLECHHSVLDFSKDVEDEQNMSIISIPTVFDPSLAPDGYHIVHAYSAACDSFDEWEKFLPEKSESGKVGVSPNSGAAKKYGMSDSYQAYKDEKAQELWRAVEQVIPDIRQRVADDNSSVVLVGTPLTHRRYNQRYRGTYGPGTAPGEDVWNLPGAVTGIDNLLACGDTTFPGIGLPGVAASGTIAANTLTPVQKQLDLMRELKQKGSLQ